MELYGGTEWRTSETDNVKRCIRRILERKLEDNYQKNSRPSEEVICALEEIVGENWRKEQGVPGRNYIGMIAKRERMKKRESLPAEDKDTKNEETKGERGEQESGDPRKKNKNEKAKM